MSATVAEITPGVYDIPAEIYHADPIPGGSLSSSGARKLLPPSCPALFKWEQDNPPGPKKTFEIGTAAHKLVLGTGPELVRIDADAWRTDAIKAQVAEVRERGAVPLKPAEWDQVHAMAAELRAHRLASALFNPDHGRAEQTLIWQDEDTGIWRRAMVDWLPASDGRRLLIGDYKTTQSVNPRAVRKAVYEHGYYQQADWYTTGAKALGLAEDAAFLFVFQAKDPPYLVSVVQLDDDAMDAGRERNRQAIEVYRDCQESGIWPSYGDGITYISLPPWARRDIEEYTP